MVPEDSRKSYLALAAKGIRARWPGFRKYQLLTMNAKQAALFHQHGRITPDLQALCNSIKRMIPKAFQNIVEKSLRHAYTFVYSH